MMVMWSQSDSSSLLMIHAENDVRCYEVLIRNHSISVQFPNKSCRCTEEIGGERAVFHGISGPSSCNIDSSICGKSEEYKP
jgi:hypothetical protein